LNDDPDFKPLISFLQRVPAIRLPIGAGPGQGETAWWVKFAIDLSDPLAWRVVQELGHVLNYLSANERLPTVFMPVSPPPYLNGGPADFLSWVIECRDRGHTPRVIADWLDGRLPCPVNDRGRWEIDA
jgi:hypothetical protein